MTLTGKKEIDMWKPGQLVTINKRVYRVTRTNNPFRTVTCHIECDMWLDNNPESLSVRDKKVCQKICFSVNCPMLGSCYLKRIKPKSSIG